jgi:hypothetical protein
MNSLKIISPKRFSFWKLWFFTWIKPRATIRKVLEVVSCGDSFFLLWVTCLVIPLSFCFMFFLEGLKDIPNYLVLGIEMLICGSLLITSLVALVTRGWSWLLKLLCGGPSKKETLKEIFYANLWIISSAGILFSIILCGVEIGVFKFFAYWNPQADAEYLGYLFVFTMLAVFIALFIWLLCIYIICLSEIMKISKRRIVIVTLLMIFIMSILIILPFLPRIIVFVRNYW